MGPLFAWETSWTLFWGVSQKWLCKKISWAYFFQRTRGFRLVQNKKRQKVEYHPQSREEVISCFIFLLRMSPWWLKHEVTNIHTLARTVNLLYVPPENDCVMTKTYGDLLVKWLAVGKIRKWIQVYVSRYLLCPCYTKEIHLIRKITSKSKTKRW